MLPSSICRCPFVILITHLFTCQPFTAFICSSSSSFVDLIALSASIHPFVHPSIYHQLADLLFITTSHIQLWPLYEATANRRGQKYEINQTLLPHWPFSYWAAVKLSCYTVWMAPDGNCLEMADKFTCWAEVQNPLASSSAVSLKKKKTLRGEDELTH